MQVRPPEVSDAQVATLVADAWAVPVRGVEYLPWGYGSHHWRADLASGGVRFVTLDRTGALGGSGWSRLLAALGAARALADAGVDLVVAPERSPSGEVLVPWGSTWAAATYPWLDDAVRVEPDAREVVVEALAVVHESAVRADVDDLVVPDHEVLEAALADGFGWGTGPFGEEAAAMVERAAPGLRTMLEEHDVVAALVAGRRDDWVLTHGEPKPGNQLTTAAGLRVVDWDTARVAPPERDLWMVDAGQGAELERYAALTGHRPDPAVVAWYRLRWVLADVAAYVADFSAPHDDDPDTRTAIDALRGYLTEVAAGRLPDPDLGWG